MEISGKDWMINVSEEDLVKLAMRLLHDNGEQITLRSVSEMSGLSVQTVKSVVQQMAAARQAKEQ